MPDTLDITALRSVIRDAEEVAKRYRNLTGKPLGITGEIGEFTVADLMNLRLTEARQPGYDAIAPDGHCVQIKARCISPDSKASQRLGSIKLDHKWDTVMLVLMDTSFEPIAIYEAPRTAIERELTKPGSKARNERGALSIGKFKAISSVVWSKEAAIDTRQIKC